ncbi:MAG: hypothetical protein P4M11_01975 [Candidatus Pacebacteria bacterium]|nr:hypothetical protein [Candidatus Paceibacterota bacterium]
MTDLNEAGINAAILASTKAARARDREAARWPDDYDEDEREIIVEMYRAARAALNASKKGT